MRGSLPILLLAVLAAAVISCSKEEDDGGGGGGSGSSNAQPQLQAPDVSAGDISVSGSYPAYSGVVNLGGSLAVSFIATDANISDLLTTSVSITGGTLSATGAGFAQAFPYAPAAATSPHTITLSGTAANSGTIELTASVDDGRGGSDQVTLMIAINTEPMLASPNVSAGSVTLGGSYPTYSGDVAIGGSLAVSFVTTDADVGNTLTTTVSVTGGTLSATGAGFVQTFPYSPTGATSPHTVALTGAAANAGTIELTVTADDGRGGSDQITLMITINAEPTLSAPNTSGGDIAVSGTYPNYTGLINLGGNLAVSFVATDADAGDTLTTTVSITGGTLSAVGAGFSQSFPYAPSGTTSPHTVALSGTAANSGTIELTITVSDGRGGSDQITLMITINAEPTLSAPNTSGGDIAVSGSYPNYTGLINLGGNLAVSFVATDADAGDTLTTTVSITGGTLSATGAGFAQSFPYAPSGTTSPQSVAVSGTAANRGTIELTVDVADGRGGSDQITLMITINAQPVLGSPIVSGGDISLSGTNPTFSGLLNLGGSLAASFQATDADSGNTLTATISVTGGTLTGAQAGFTQGFPYAPSGSTSPHSIAISGTAASAGTIQLTIGVDDGQGGSDQITLTITINAQPVLTAPNVSSGDISLGGSYPNYTGLINDGGNLAVSFEATDADTGNTLTTAVAVTGGTLSAAAAGFTQSFPFSPSGSTSPHSVALSGTASATGTIQLTVGVSDGQGGTDQFVITISINAIPTLLAPTTSSGDTRIVGTDPNFFGRTRLGGSLAISFQATDADTADTLTTTVSVSGGTLSPSQAGFNESFPYAPSGSTSPHTVSLTGTVARRGTIEITVSVSDGRGGTDQIVVLIRLGSRALDFNGDGYEDVVVAAIQADDGGADSGAAYVFFGSSNPPASVSASTADVVLVGGDAGDLFGISVHSAGDFNGDGYDDIIVGASNDDDAGNNSGAAFIFFGSPSPATTIDASAASVRLIAGDMEDAFGWSVSSAGDFNGDGFDDVIVGAESDELGGTNSGAAFIFFGSSSPASSISVSSADVTLVGGDPADFFGGSVSSLGDFNGDGYDDVIVGARLDSDGGTNAGTALIFIGSASPPSSIDASAADVLLIGADAQDQFGFSVSSAGDVNGDGYDDALVGARDDDNGGSNSGAAFVFFGSASPPTTVDASIADITLIGGDPDDSFGNDVSPCGDINRDGYADFAIAAINDDDGGTGSGVVFIFLGSANPSASIDASSADWILIGGDPTDVFGNGLASAGDFDGDGYDDVLVGAHADDDGGSGSGAAFVFLGSVSLPVTTDASAADMIIIGVDPGDILGWGVGGR